MILAEMPFGVGRVRKGNRRLRILHVVGGDTARLFFPLLDDGGIADDVDLALVIGETHPPAETRFVEIAKLRLVSVVGRRARRSAPLPAAGQRGGNSPPR